MKQPIQDAPSIDDALARARRLLEDSHNVSITIIDTNDERWFEVIDDGFYEDDESEED